MRNKWIPRSKLIDKRGKEGVDPHFFIVVCTTLYNSTLIIEIFYLYLFFWFVEYMYEDAIFSSIFHRTTRHAKNDLIMCISVFPMIIQHLNICKNKWYISKVILRFFFFVRRTESDKSPNIYFFNYTSMNELEQQWI